MLISPVDENERQILEKFTAQVQDLQQNDETLLRFLRARDHNIQKADDMLRKAMKWRAERKFGSVLTWSIPKIIEEDMTFEWMGSDNEGRPVMLIPLGQWNTREIIEKGYKTEVVDFVYFLLESIMYKLKEVNCSQVSFIYGMDGLTMWKIANIDTVQVLYNAFQDLEANYPEIIKTIYVINAPWAFSVAFNIIKPILSPHTISKFQVYNSDRKKWYPVLLENMPLSSIPLKYQEES